MNKTHIIALTLSALLLTGCNGPDLAPAVNSLSSLEIGGIFAVFLEIAVLKWFVLLYYNIN